ncbi:MAG TPA: co-chaperone DjlA [Steroidobacteraceae bacterium]|nr:co-chaperone DjlA [Steroidobacteraceae bacterium]
MQWKGKVIGGVVGAVLGLGPLGAAIGLLLGHQFDRFKEAEEAQGEAGGDPQLISAVFFRSAFAVMGCIAKADGRVSESEIQAARGIMRHLRLTPEQVQAAIRFFNEGKQPDFALERTVRELRQVCGRRHDLLRYFVEIQMSAALQGGNLRGAGRPLVQSVAQWLGLSMFEIAHLEALLRLQAGERPEMPGRAGERLAGAYQVLQIEASATDAEVVKAYRRQMSRNHPDKLVANGLPPSMMEIAKEKTQRIREAYEVIREQRGMK